MRVSNIFVSEKELFLDLLVRDLIKNGISYVQIENEFHFLDRIYRFFDVNDLTTIDKAKELAQAVSCLCFSIDDFFQKKSCFKDSIIEIRTKYELPPETSCKTYHKQQIKAYNRRVNHQLRQFKK